MKRSSILTLSTIFFILLFTVMTVAQTYTLSLGHGTLERHPTHLGAVRFAELVEERSNGRLKIDIFPNRQLGEEREMVEGLQLGTVDITVVSTGPLGGFVKEINVLDLPFLFQSNTHAYGVFDGPIGDDLLAMFDNVGIIGAAIWENGWRNLTTNKPVTRPEDLRGIKIRTMENEIHMAAFQRLGASPVPMVWGEVYTSLRQGVIDAQENPITIIYVNNLWEVQDYVQLTGHVYGPHLVLLSKQSIERLPEDLQKLLIDTAKEVSTYQRMMSQRLEEEQKAELIKEGMEILEVNIAPFQELVKPVFDDYRDVFGTYIDRILGAGGN